MAPYYSDTQSDARSQHVKKTAPHHMVACYDDACVHWVPVDENFHWYHNSCLRDEPSGTDYTTALERLRKHMDTCDAEIQPIAKPIDPEVIP